MFTEWGLARRGRSPSLIETRQTARDHDALVRNSKGCVVNDLRRAEKTALACCALLCRGRGSIHRGGPIDQPGASFTEMTQSTFS
jgi:hypothetical protein